MNILQNVVSELIHGKSFTESLWATDGNISTSTVMRPGSFLEINLTDFGNRTEITVVNLSIMLLTVAGRYNYGMVFCFTSLLVTSAGIKYCMHRKQY